MPCVDKEIDSKEISKYTLWTKVSLFKRYIRWYTYLPLGFNRHTDSEFKASCSMTLMCRLKLLFLKYDRNSFTETKN